MLDTVSVQAYNVECKVNCFTIGGGLTAEKDLKITLLLDFYGEVLTEKQREVIGLYYNDDLSLGEIAEQAGITRQGVRDCIKRGETVLENMESKLGLASRFDEIKSTVARINRDAQKINELCERYCAPDEIGALASDIKTLAESLEQ